MAFRLGYRPALDGVRGLAILVVMAVHAALPVPPGGFLSVDLFFVLSGFLITSVLLEEWDRTSTIRLVGFYMRRALRLLPGLLVFLVALVAFSLTFPTMAQARELWREAFYTFFYVTNWAIAFGAMPALGWLGHAWTLAIEEQFYLVWPWLLLAMLRAGMSRRRVVLATGGLIAMAALHRLALWHDGATIERLFFGFDTRCDSLLAGCVAGIVASIPPERVPGRLRRWMPVAGGVGAVVVAGMMVMASREAAYMPCGGFTLFAVAAAAAILDLVHRPHSLLARALALRPLVHAGRISYGLYLWHWPVFLSLLPMWTGLTTMQSDVLRFAVTWLAAELSFRLVESPCLRWKSRWSPGREPASSPREAASGGAV